MLTVLIMITQKKKMKKKRLAASSSVKKKYRNRTNYWEENILGSILWGMKKSAHIIGRHLWILEVLFEQHNISLRVLNLF